MTFNGQDYLLRATSTSPLDLLSGLGLSLGPGDALLADGVLWRGAEQALPHHLALERTVEFTIQVGGAKLNRHQRANGSLRCVIDYYNSLRFCV